MNTTPTPYPLEPISWILSILICLTALSFSYAANLDLHFYQPLLREDGWLENLSAICLVLGSVLLFASAKMAPNWIARGCCFLGGLALVFGAGEEISWMQRVFDFETPERVRQVNAQSELNLHNMHWFRVSVLINELPLLLCVISLAAFFAGRRSLFGIRLPTPPLVFALLLALMYGRSLSLNRWLSWNEILLLFSFLFCMFQSRTSLAFASASVLSASLAIRFVNRDRDSPAQYTYWEAHEYLVCLVLLCYSIEIFRGFRPVAGSRQNQESDRRWHLGFVLVAAGGLGLAIVGQMGDRIRQTVVEDVLRRLETAEQLVDAHFDVYLDEGDEGRRELLYIREPCANADRGPFFLHVYPRNVDMLPRYRRRFAFENYHISQAPWRFQQTCTAVMALPSYEIELIETGQFPGPTWREAFSFGPESADAKTP